MSKLKHSENRFLGKPLKIKQNETKIEAEF